MTARVHHAHFLAVPLRLRGGLERQGGRANTPRLKNLIAGCLALAVLWGCQPAETVQTAGPQAQADSLFRAYSDFKIQINPIEATKAGDRSHNDRLVNYISDAQVAFLREQYAAFLAAIDQVPLDSLSDADQLSLRVMRWEAA